MQQTKKLEENKIETRQQNKERKIKTLLSSPTHLAHHCSAVAPLSLRCHTDISALLHFCRSAVAPLLHRYHSTVAPPLSLRCCAAVAPLFHRYCSTVSALLSLLLLLRCCAAITPLSLHCCSAAVAPAVATYSHRYRTVSHRCRTAVAPAQRGYKQFNIELLLLYCHSTVASDVNQKVHMVVASRGIIRVTVTIGDCQACVSSSSEGCSTWQKTVKVEAY